MSDSFFMSLLLAAKGGHGPDKLRLERRPGQVPDLGFGDNEQIQSLPQQIFVPPEKITKPPFDLVPLHGIADLPAYDDGHPGIAQVTGKVNQIKISASVTVTFFIEKRKIVLFPDPLLRTEAFVH
jgi:hypothetical protein